MAVAAARLSDDADVDNAAAGTDAGGMRRHPRHLLRVPGLLLGGVLATGTGLAQATVEVPLPDRLGRLHAGPAWTVLDGTAIASATRPTDPQEDPARALLVATCRTLTERQRAERHVLLHQLGSAPNQVRLVNAYSEPLAKPTAQLLAPAAVAELRAAFEKSLSTPDNQLEYVGERTLDLFASTRCLSLSFRTTTGADTFCLDYYFVPAGPRLAYFEAVYLPGDRGAREAIEALLRTFDGAVDPGEGSSLLKSMTIGGLTGAIAGVFAAMLRRRLRANAAARAAE